MNCLCKIFGHKFRKGWAGAKSGYFGAIVINHKMCERCSKSEYEYTSDIRINLP